jgi:hypothetical protein
MEIRHYIDVVAEDAKAYFETCHVSAVREEIEDYANRLFTNGGDESLPDERALFREAAGVAQRTGEMKNGVVQAGAENYFWTERGTHVHC